MDEVMDEAMDEVMDEVMEEVEGLGIAAQVGQFLPQWFHYPLIENHLRIILEHLRTLPRKDLIAMF